MRDDAPEPGPRQSGAGIHGVLTGEYSERNEFVLFDPEPAARAAAGK